MILFLLIFAFCLFPFNLVQAATFYVSSGASGSSGGSSVTAVAAAGSNGVSCSTAQTISTPKLTIGNAISCLNPGDTLYIRGGYYNEHVDFNTTMNNGTVGARILISSNPGEVVLVRGSINPGSAATVAPHHGLSYVTFSGNTGYNMIWDGTGYKENGASASCCADDGVNPNPTPGPGAWSFGITYEFMELKNWGGCPTTYNGCGTSGIEMHGHDGVVRDSWIHNNGGPDVAGFNTGAGYGIYDAGINTIMDRLVVSGNTGYGIQTFSGDCPGGACSNRNGNTIRNSTFFGNGTANYSSGGNCVGGWADVVSTSGRKYIHRNVFYSTPGVGCSGIQGGARGSAIYNNTFVGTGAASDGAAWNLSQNTTTTTYFINNLIYKMRDPDGAMIYSFGCSGCLAPVVANNLCDTSGFDMANACTLTPKLNSSTNPPRFVNEAAHDYHLQTSPIASPAINVGTATICATCSLTNGVVTVAGASGTLPDVGAFESGLATLVQITSPTINPTYTNPVGVSTINLSGTATGATAVSWTCPRCGTSGGATGTTTWSLTVNGLKAGENIITVQADPGAVTAQITVTYPPTFPGNTLAGAWGFETGSGTIATDSSGNKNDGSLINGVTWLSGTGKFGNAISLNGSNQYVSVASTAPLNFTQSFTYSGWIKPHAVYNDFRAFIVKNGTPPADYVQFLYASTAGSSCGSGGQVGGFYPNGSNATGFSACDALELPVGNWTHIALTYDNAAQQLKFYKNGALVQTTTASGYMEPTTGALTIGHSLIAAYGGEWLDADVDEIRAYNFAIPISAGANTSAGATCGYSDYTATVKASSNYSLASVIGDQNCPIVPQVITPPVVKIPAAANGLKVGSAATFKFGATP